MVALNDRLDRVIGAKSAKPLEEHFGIDTVDDLLRHYPRKYSDGMTVRGEGEDLELDEGQHVTFVDTITDVVVQAHATPTGQAATHVCRRHARRPTAQGDGHVLQRRLPGEATLVGVPGDAVGRGRRTSGRSCS